MTLLSPIKIETYWNVNIIQPQKRYERYKLIKIETYWNVNKKSTPLINVGNTY